MSSYIINRTPQKYGGEQENYLMRSQEIVFQAVKNFHEAVHENKDLSELFHETLAFFETERKNIALSHGTKNAKLFGSRRDEKEIHETGYTGLGSPYDEYNKKLLGVLQKHLRTMKHTCKEFQDTELEIHGKPCLGKKSLMQLSILTFENLRTWKHLPNYLLVEECKRVCELSGFPPPKDQSDIEKILDLLLRNKEAMLRLKQNSIEEYKKIKLFQILTLVRNSYQGRKSDWVHVTIRLEINGKMYALSQYITWMYRDFKEDPVEHMTGRSIIAVVHQDPFLIEPMLQEIANVFKKAIECDRNRIEKLKKRVALFQYEFAHAMPESRGTAAISEWFEAAIYRFHGYKLTYKPEKMVNLEALTSLLDEFVSNYDSMVEVEKL